MGRLLAGVSFLGTPSTGHPDVADGSTTALTNGDGFRPVAGPAARTRRRRAQETLGREFYEVLTRQVEAGAPPTSPSTVTSTNR